MSLPENQNLQGTHTEFEVTDLDKISLDLSGNNWQFEGLLPDKGVAIGLHQLAPDITGDAFNWSYAKVPGDVYTDLWRSGRIDDPHFGRNSMKAKWVPDMEWWYKRQFNIPQEMSGKRLRLIFEGVDFAYDVWLNGTLLGSHEGMFSPAVFDVTDVVSYGTLRHGSNVLMIRLHPAPRRYSQVAGRKPAWHGDYWVSLPPTGIWRPIKLEAIGEAIIEDLYVKSEVESEENVHITFEIEVNNLDESAQEFHCELILSPKNFEGKSYAFSLRSVFQTGKSILKHVVTLNDIKLWWPWDLGEQNLYTVSLVLKNDSGVVQDKKQLTTGISQVKMTMNPGFTTHQVENPWTVMMNDRRHFMRSGTWGGPPDIFFGRASEDKYRELIRMAKEANLNNLRIFGWHPVEIPLFYELCNEAGITVWQDTVPLASLSLPKDAAFKKAVFEEAISIVKSQRNHPCLVLLEGAEESFMTASDPQYNLEFVLEMGEAIKPYTHLNYIPGSPLSDDIGISLGFKPNESYHANDLFYAEGKLIMEEYFPSLDFAVIPELAISSCPNVESIKKFIPADEIWPPGPSWGHHWTDFDALRTLNYEVLGDESIHGLEKFVEATQIAQGVIFQFALEHFRRRKPRTSAICICHYITFAPDMKWGIVDYYQTKKRSFDYVKNAYQPLLVSLQYEKRRFLVGENMDVNVWIVNDFYKSYEQCQVEVLLLNQNKEIVSTQLLEIQNIEPDSAKKFHSLRFQCNEGQLGERFYLKAFLKDADNTILSENEYLLLIADQAAAKTTLKEIGEQAIALKVKYGVANYYRYFMGLGGETGVKEADENKIIARGF